MFLLIEMEVFMIVTRSIYIALCIVFVQYIHHHWDLVNVKIFTDLQMNANTNA